MDSLLKIQSQFEGYLKIKKFKRLFDKMLWGEGPCYVSANQRNCLVWS